MSVLASTTGEIGDFDVESLAVDAQTVLDAIGSVDWELSLLICDDAFIAPLNQQWRDKNEPTDVLSFPQLEVPTPGHPPVDQGALLGDIVISIDTAKRQASDLGHPIDDELRVLLVHGVSHLIGHRHDNAEASAKMLKTEERFLKALGQEGSSLIRRSSQS